LATDEVAIFVLYRRGMPHLNKTGLIIINLSLIFENPSKKYIFEIGEKKATK